MFNKKIAAVLLTGAMIFTACASNTTTTTGANGSKSGEQTADKLSKIKSAGKIVVGTSPDYPPQEFYIINAKGEKEIVGSDISLAKAIAEKIGVTLEIKATDFQAVISNIQAAQVDMGISGFSRTEKRAAVMDFSDGYAQESDNGWQGLMIRKEDQGKYKNLDDIKNAKLRLGSQAGSIQYEMATKLTDETKIKQMGTLDALVLALNAKDLDAVVISTDNATNMLKTFNDLMILDKENFNLDPDDFYGVNVVGLPKSTNGDNKTLLDVINEVIKESKANGNFEKWRSEALELAKQEVTP